MRGQLAPQAQDIRGHSDLVRITEQVDDVALLIGQMVTMGFPEVWDRPIPRHGTQRGLSWGWTAVIWLASIVTEGDHRNVSMATSIKGRHHTLSHLTAQRMAPLACSDDRLRHLRTHLRQPAYGQALERDLNERSMERYALAQHVIRCDATPGAGAHEVTAGGLGPFGQRKDEPTRPQITVLLGSLDPLGMPLATAGLSGARADDGLYLPLIERLRPGWPTSGLFCVGDGKMSALETRAYVVRQPAFDLAPLPWTGATAEAMEAWITEGGTRGEAGALQRLWRTNARGHAGLAAEGYEVERPGGEAPGGAGPWSARVLVVRSPLHANHQVAG
jgi:transposase